MDPQIAHTYLFGPSPKKLKISIPYWPIKQTNSLFHFYTFDEFLTFQTFPILPQPFVCFSIVPILSHHIFSDFLKKRSIFFSIFLCLSYIMRPMFDLHLPILISFRNLNLLLLLQPLLSTLPSNIPIS